MGIWSEKIADVRIASEFADSGSGTSVDPWINGIQEAYDDCEGYATIFLPPGKFKATHAIKLDKHSSFGIFGVGGNRCVVVTDNDVAFNLFEINETMRAYMGYLKDFKIVYYGTGVAIKNFNLSEMYMLGCEVRADRSHDGLLVFNPTLGNLNYNQIEQCYFLGGTDPTTYQIQFLKPGVYRTNEILISECFLYPGYGDPAPHWSGIIDVEDDALNKWAITSCRWENVGDRPAINIQGKIGPGGLGGIHPMRLQDYGRTDALSRLIHFNDLGAPHEARCKISGIQIEDYGEHPDYGVYIGNNWDYIEVIGNTLRDFATEAIHVAPGANLNGEIAHNVE